MPDGNGDDPVRVLGFELRYGEVQHHSNVAGDLEGSTASTGRIPHVRAPAGTAEPAASRTGSPTSPAGMMEPSGPMTHGPSGHAQAPKTEKESTKTTSNASRCILPLLWCYFYKNSNTKTVSDKRVPLGTMSTTGPGLGRLERGHAEFLANVRSHPSSKLRPSPSDVRAYVMFMRRARCGSFWPGTGRPVGGGATHLAVGELIELEYRGYQFYLRRRLTTYGR